MARTYTPLTKNLVLFFQERAHQTLATARKLSKLALLRTGAGLRKLQEDPTPSAAKTICSDQLGRFLRNGLPARQCSAQRTSTVR